MTPADKAVAHLLHRIATDADARWAIGAGTQAFHLLCVAYADLVGVDAQLVEADLTRIVVETEKAKRCQS
jgi:hypothetical protein